MKELVAYLARSLAGRPEDVAVVETPGEKGVTLELTVADGDLNALIGRQGRTIKAMRSLLAASSAKRGGRFFLKITAASAGRAGGSPENSFEASGDGSE